MWIGNFGFSSPKNPLISDYDRLAKAVAQQYEGKDRCMLSPEELKIVEVLKTLGYLSANDTENTSVGKAKKRHLTECEQGIHRHEGPCSWHGL